MSTYTKLPSFDTVQQRTNTYIESSFRTYTNKVWEAVHFALSDPYCDPSTPKKLEIRVDAEAKKVHERVIVEIRRRFKETDDWRVVSCEFKSKQEGSSYNGSYTVYEFHITFEGCGVSRPFEDVAQ